MPDVVVITRDRHHVIRDMRRGPATPGGGTGSAEPVTHILTEAPGYGITADAVLADYAALDAYQSDGWVEVTGGELGVEIWHIEYGERRGPFPPWVKNAKYTLGDSDEDILVVAPAQSLPTEFPGNNSRFTQPSTADHSDPRWQVLRLCSSWPIFAEVEILGGKTRRVVNGTSGWVVVIGAESQTSMNRVYVPAAGTIATAPIDAETSADIYFDGADPRVDAGSYSAIAGIPARYGPKSMRPTHYLTSSVQSWTGFITTDYRTLGLSSIPEIDLNGEVDGAGLVFVDGKYRPVKVALAGLGTVLDVPGTQKPLYATDAGFWLRLTGADPVSVIVSQEHVAPIPIGAAFTGVQAGDGQVTFAPDPGVTINTPVGYSRSTRGKGAVWAIGKVGPDTWDLFGDLAPL